MIYFRIDSFSIPIPNPTVTEGEMNFIRMIII